MRRVWAHGGGHEYDDRAHHVTYRIPAGGCVELPDDVADLLLQNHPTKLCDVTEADDPDAHTCKLSKKDAGILEKLEQDRAAVESQASRMYPHDMSLTQRRRAAELFRRTGGKVSVL